MAREVSEAMQWKHKALVQEEEHFRRGKFTSEEANMSKQGGNSQATQSQTGDIMRVGSEKGDS